MRHVVMRKKKCKICHEWFNPTRQMQPACKNHEYDYALIVIKRNQDKKKAKDKKKSKEAASQNSRRKKQFLASDRRHQFKLTKSVVQKWLIM